MISEQSTLKTGEMMLKTQLFHDRHFKINKNFIFNLYSNNQINAT